jgi:hypothetical protein
VVGYPRGLHQARFRLAVAARDGQPMCQRGLAALAGLGMADR